jgi:hypothetical protein
MDMQIAAIFGRILGYCDRRSARDSALPGRARRKLRYETVETRTLLACTVVDENWVDGGGGCKDANSQLVWSLSGVETTGSNFTQAGAKQFANNLVQGGFSDWRLPTKAELEEAAGHGLRNHANFGNGHFWTSTSSGNKRFWAIMLRTGQALDLSKSSIIGAVAVRGVRAPVVHSTPNIRVYSTQIVTSEPMGMAAFTVALDTPPTANVTIPVTSTDATEGLPSVNSITFTPQNWNVPQFVRVNAVDDAIADGPQTFAIRLGPATSTDPNYHNLTAEEVTVLNLDDEPPPAAGAAVANASRDEPRGPSLGAARRSVEPLSQAAVDRHMAETPVIHARRTAARGVARTWRLVGSQIDEQNL